MHLLTLIGLVFIALGTGLTIFGQQIINNKSNASLQKKSDENIALSKVNVRLSEINSDLSKQSLDQITGGDSWAFLSGGISTLDGMANQPFMLVLNHVGQSPLRGLNIEIYNIKFSDNTVPKSHTLTTIFKKEVGTLANTLYPVSLDIIELPNEDRVDLKVKLNAINGEIIQHWIFVKKENGYWSTAKNVFKFLPNKDGGFSRKELFHEIDTDFPETSINWLEI